MQNNPCYMHGLGEQTQWFSDQNNTGNKARCKEADMWQVHLLDINSRQITFMQSNGKCFSLGKLQMLRSLPNGRCFLFGQNGKWSTVHKWQMFLLMPGKRFLITNLGERANRRSHSAQMPTNSMHTVLRMSFTLCCVHVKMIVPSSWRHCGDTAVLKHWCCS